MFNQNQTEICKERGLGNQKSMLIEISETARRVLTRALFREMLAAIFTKIAEEPEKALWVVKSGGTEIWGLLYEGEEPEGGDRLVIM